MRTWKAAAVLTVFAVLFLTASPAMAVPPPGSGVFHLPKITVTSPANNMEVWYSGGWHDVTWTATGGSEPVDVYLQKGEGSLVKIGTSRSGGKANLWIPANSVQGLDYRLVVASVNMPAIKGTSKSFAVSPLPTFKITAPNGGETWFRGTTHNITWTYTGYPDKVSLLLFHYGDALNYRTIAEGVSPGTNGSGSYSWKIPDDLEPGSDYRLWIIIPHTAANDTSDQNFSVREKLDIHIVNPGTLHH